ncbi:MAG: 5'-methylthioadenosine/adenosylhomocysteine nucleosidase [Erysipelothrix sp.]
MILIIGAMDEEVSALKTRMSTVEERLFQNVQLFEGTLSEKQVVVARSGVGKVNAAYTATTLIHHFNPDLVINIGSAGGLKENQTVGDIVVATKLQYHDLDIGPETPTDPRFAFTPSAKHGRQTTQLLSKLEMKYHEGLIVSGDQFITKYQSQFAVIAKNFPEAICVEMEAAAIAAVCERTETDFIVLRSLSDVTHVEGNDMDFETYLGLASEKSALICAEYLKTL